MNWARFLTVAEVWASGPVEHHAPSPTDVIFPVINFLIYAGIIAYFAMPVLRDYLRSRRTEVSGLLQAADASRRRAEAFLAEYTGRLGRVEQEMAAVAGALRSDGEKERAKLVAEAESLGAKIRKDAQVLAEQEIKVARQRLREEIAARAESSARELILRDFNRADQTRLIEDFLRQIGSSR